MSSDRRIAADGFAKPTVAVLLLAMLITACGKKGDPLPPFRVIPASVQDLELRQQGTDVVLELGYPKVSLGGAALPGVESLEILQFQQNAPAEGFDIEISEAQFEASAESARTLRGEGLTRSTAGDRVTLRIALGPDQLSGEQALTFGARSTATNGEESGLSNLASIVPLEPPTPPTGLTLLPGADGVEIRWALAAGDEIEGFNVYRRDSRSPNYRKPLARADADEDRYLDRSARFGGRYIYTVTTVRATEPIVESRLSGEAEVFYQDRFPPEPPSELVALAESDRIRLRWDASPSGDVVGYNVYRKGVSDFRRLTRRPVTDREFVDDRVRVGRTYVYRITAVDNLGNESVPSDETSTEVR